MRKASFDFETFSECDIRKAGAWAYAAHPSTRILCLGYAYDDEPPQLWVPGDSMPDFIINPEKYELHAWNSFFEYAVWKFCWPELPVPPLTHWHDTAALASAMALPRALGNCGKALGMPSNVSKDKRGYELIKLLSIPNKMNGDPKLTKEMHDYCLQDVVAERALSKKLYSLNSTERQVFILDQKINIKGIRVDVDRVDDALDVYEKTFANIKDRLTQITGLGNANSQKQFYDWMIDQGHMLNDVTKGTLSAILDKEDTQGTHEAIRLRMSLAKTAPKKYASMRTRVGNGTRLHGNVMYHGASTGRWASTGVNLQNIARPTVDPDMCIPLLAGRDLDLFDMVDIDPMEALSSCVRGMLVPSEGKKFIIGDYASIESRALAWLAGEEEKLEIFRGHGKMYEYVASKIFKKDIDDITKPERFVGKIGELACGYGGGAGALQGMAEVYKAPMTKSDAEKIKQQWRKANPEICKFWYEIEQAAREAVQSTDVKQVRGIKFVVKAGFLVCQLPSGRRLYFYRPSIVNKKVVMYKVPETEDAPEMSYIYSSHEYRSFADFEEQAQEAGQEIFEFIAMNIEFWGVDSKTKKWCRQSTYGGKLVENITQAVARDLMAESMLALDKAGYEIVLTVHDEIISEVTIDDKTKSVEDFTRIMEETPGWATGLPVAVEAYQALRYRK